MMVKDIALRSLNGTPAVDLPLLDIGMPYDDPLRHGQIPVHLKFCKVSDAVGPQHNFYIGGVGCGIGLRQNFYFRPWKARFLQCQAKYPLHIRLSDQLIPVSFPVVVSFKRSEERRVGKEGASEL